MFQPVALPRTLPACLRDLEHGRGNVRHSALRDLGRFETEPERARAVSACAQVLRKDPEGFVRAQAAMVLADLGAHEATEALLEATSDRDAGVRQHSVLALGEVATPRAAVIAAVTRAAVDFAAPVRYQAVVASGRLCSTLQLGPVLHRALSDPDAEVRHVSVRVAEDAYVGHERDSEHVLLPPEIEQALCGALADTSPAVALAAVILLAKAGKQTLGSKLAELLNGPLGVFDVEDECTALALCVDWGLLSAKPGLERRARQFAGGTVTWDARIALARLGDAWATRRIVRGLSAWSYDQRMLAVHAAGQARLEAALAGLRALRARPGRADREAVDDALKSIAQFLARTSGL